MNFKANKSECSFEELIELAGMYPAEISIPEPYFRDLPPLYNTERERRRVSDELIAERIDKAIETFFEAMNDTAASIGMTKTNFATAHGGVNVSENYSTARDIATLAGYVVRKHELFIQICNTKHYSAKSRLKKDYEYRWQNTN
jgi:hypothetical protein